MTISSVQQTKHFTVHPTISKFKVVFYRNSLFRTQNDSDSFIFRCSSSDTPKSASSSDQTYWFFFGFHKRWLQFKVWELSNDKLWSTTKLKKKIQKPSETSWITLVTSYCTATKGKRQSFVDSSAILYKTSMCFTLFQPTLIHCTTLPKSYQ